MERESQLLSEKIELLTIVMAAVLDKLATLTANEDELPMSERIPPLYSLGLSRSQIARVLGTKPEVVSVRMAESRRKKAPGFTRPKARTEE